MGVNVLNLNPLPLNFLATSYTVTTANPTPPPGGTPTPTYNAVSQLYVNGVCLSCNPLVNSGAPSPSLYKVQGALSPKQDWVLVVGEMASHPAFGGDSQDVTYEIQNGIYGDLWAVTPDGAHWYNLTNLVAPSNGGVVGTLAAQLSPDETKIVWSTAAPGNAAGPIGENGGWDLMEASFVVTNGVPSLQTVQDLSPMDGIWYEAHDWSPDASKIVVSSDLGEQYFYGGDNFLVDLGAGTWTNITNQPLYWEEHSYYSPNGQKILMAEQAPNAALLPQDATLPYDQWRPLLRSEAWVMNPDGSQAMQLTGFGVQLANGTPDPEYDPQEVSVVMGMTWNSTGNQVLVPQTVLNGTTVTTSTVAHWLITFAGNCGG